MRIIREKGGKHIIVNATVDLDVQKNDGDDKEKVFASLMNDYAIPLLIEMGERMFRAIQHDLSKTDKPKRYAFSLVCQDISE